MKLHNAQCTIAAFLCQICEETLGNQKLWGLWNITFGSKQRPFLVHKFVGLRPPPPSTLLTHPGEWEWVGGITRHLYCCSSDTRAQYVVVRWSLRGGGCTAAWPLPLRTLAACPPASSSPILCDRNVPLVDWAVDEPFCAFMLLASCAIARSTSGGGGRAAVMY